MARPLLKLKLFKHLYYEMNGLPSTSTGSLDLRYVCEVIGGGLNSYKAIALPYSSLAGIHDALRY